MKFFRRILIFALLTLIAVGIVRGFGNVSDIGNAGKKTGEPAVAPEPKPLKFAVMSDIHLDTESLKPALEKARKDGAEFVIVTGDLTSLGKKNELSDVKKALDQGGLKYFVIPGNHDLWWSQKIKANVFGEVFGEDFQSFKLNGVKFILVNDGGVGGIEDVRGMGGEKQGEWLRKEIEECPQITCLVFLHMPLNHPNSLHILGEGNEKLSGEAKAWVKLFTEDGVKEVFAGHLHYSSSYELEGLKTTIVGAITRDRNPQSPKFLEVWGEGEKLERKEIFVAD